MRHTRLLASSLLAAPLILGLAGMARGATTPDESKAPAFAAKGAADDLKEVKEVQWKASGQGGLIMSTGNAQSTTMSAGLEASRRDRDNKLSLSLAGAYARSTLVVGTDTNTNGFIDPDEISQVSKTSTKNWASRLRYDRFLTESNAAYVTGLAGADEIAGKDFIGGFQAGYSRTVFRDAMHEVLAELGYDYSYESYLVEPSQSLSIHSLRFFLGYTAKLSAETGLNASVETLHNVNDETTPVRTIGPFKDTRLNTKVGATTVLYKDISLRFGFGLKYDNEPAPRAPLGPVKFAPGFVPLAEKLDSLTEIGLIVTFL